MKCHCWEARSACIDESRRQTVLSKLLVTKGRLSHRLGSNGRPEVRELLQTQFGGVPINKQNLSEWRQGGYRESKIRAELLDHPSELADFADELDDSVDSDLLGDNLTMMVAVRYAALLRGWDGQVNAKFEVEVRVLQRLSQDVLQLQKGVHRASRFKDEWEQRLQKESTMKGRVTEWNCSPQSAQ